MTDYDNDNDEDDDGDDDDDDGGGDDDDQLTFSSKGQLVIHLFNSFYRVFVSSPHQLPSSVLLQIPSHPCCCYILFYNRPRQAQYPQISGIVEPDSVSPGIIFSRSSQSLKSIVFLCKCISCLGGCGGGGAVLCQKRVIQTHPIIDHILRTFRHNYFCTQACGQT